MAKKLTLNIDEKIIEEAKKYARKKQKSLSRIVQDYLKVIVKLNNKEVSSFSKSTEIELSPTVKQLLGSVKIDQEKLKKINDEKFKYLKEKYLERYGIH